MKDKILKDLLRLIDEFIKDEINIVDVKKWLMNHPDKRRFERLNDQDVKSIRKVFKKIDMLIQKPVNINDWKKLKDNIANNI